MGQITVTISDANQRALEAEARHRGRSIDSLMDESLIAAAASRDERLRRFFDVAAENWQKLTPEMSEEEALDWAVREVQAHRRENRRPENDSANRNP
jgi:hypothetical protein